MRDTKNVKGATAAAAALDAFPAQLRDGPLRRALGEAVQQEILPAARQRARRASGALAAGLTVQTSVRGSKAIGSLVTKGAHAGVARWIEYGTKAHFIRARRSRALRYKVVGGRDARGRFSANSFRFASIVSHPGFKPMKFMRPALDSKRGAVVGAAARALQRALVSRQAFLAGFK